MTQLDETVAINVLPADGAAPAGKLADVELHFTAGALEGLKLLGFTVWEGRGDKSPTMSRTTWLTASAAASLCSDRAATRLCMTRYATRCWLSSRTTCRTRRPSVVHPK